MTQPVVDDSAAPATMEEELRKCVAGGRGVAGIASSWPVVSGHEKKHIKTRGSNHGRAGRAESVVDRTCCRHLSTPRNDTSRGGLRAGSGDLGVTTSPEAPQNPWQSCHRDEHAVSVVSSPPALRGVGWRADESMEQPSVVAAAREPRPTPRRYKTAPGGRRHGL